MNMKPIYNRVLLKLSGESLQGDSGYGISPDVLNTYAAQIKEVLNLGVQVGIVIGGGNIFRGLSGVNKGFDRVKGDHMGMLATVINSIGMQCALEGAGVDAHTLTSVFMEPIGESYSKNKAIDYMKQGRVVIIAGGTGNPFFSTDTASALRAVELEADVLLKGTRVDGVYTADPEKDKTAQKYDTLTFDEALTRNLRVMDLTAFALCKENSLPVIVFDMNNEGNFKKIVTGNNVGTIVR
ncbi:uridylate kinase [Bacteroidia bacterium]|nr:uridylate kinase [Bacteroidia bacterium]